MLKTEGIKSAEVEQGIKREATPPTEVVRLSFEVKSAVKAIPYPDAYPRMAPPQT